jgi:hypothetical protein
MITFSAKITIDETNNATNAVACPEIVSVALTTSVNRSNTINFQNVSNTLYLGAVIWLLKFMSTLQQIFVVFGVNHIKGKLPVLALTIFVECLPDVSRLFTVPSQSKH